MSHTRFPILDRCALCGSDQPLQSSHLLPDSLFRRLREGNGRFYAASQPRRAVQRGAVARLLCFRCEQRFSLWEGAFAKMFLPSDREPKLPLRYGPWLQLLAVSISWRALAFLAHATPKPHARVPDAAQRVLPPLPKESHAAADRALERWREALLKEKAPSDLNDQHLIFLNGKNVAHERSAIVGFTTCCTDSFTAVIAQLGAVCLLGMIEDRAPLQWKGTRIQSLGGIFPVSKQAVPPSFGTWLGSYFASLHEVGFGIREGNGEDARGGEAGVT